MTLLLTRPAEDSEPLARILAGHGLDCLIEPLLGIHFLDADLPTLDGIAALLATSANGIRAFARLSENRDLAVMAVGDASARAARELGFTRVDSAGGDVDDLARRVAETLDPAAGALLHMAGSKLAGDLRGLVEAAGFTYRRVVLYESRMAESFSPGALAAFAGHRITGVLLFSPRTAKCFARLAEGAGLDLSPVTAYCLSRNVADSLAGAGFGARIQAEAPTQDSLVRAIVDSVPC